MMMNSAAKQSVVLLAGMGALAIVGLVILALYGITEALILGALIFIANTAVTAISALTQIKE